jgi:hypothetical protein
LGCRWVYIGKVGPDGKIDHFKVRLVVKGYTHTYIYFLDYGDTFSPVGMINFVHLFLAATAIHHSHFHRLDIKNAFFTRRVAGGSLYGLASGVYYS